MKCVPKVSHKATFMLDNRGVNDIIQEEKKTMCHSWEELSFAPWVTHGVHKMPKSMHNTRPYIENYVICLKRIFLYTIPMNLIYISSGVTRGTPCSYFTSNVKIPIYTGKIPLYREKNTSFASDVNPCTFNTELAMNLIYIYSGVTRGTLLLLHI